ncbi:hypothetical protein IWQ61_010721, partial [Dispira simplex]
MQDNNHSVPIPFLEADNYDQWSEGVYSLLVICKLWDVVNPEPATPSVRVKREKNDESLDDQVEGELICEMNARLVVRGYISKEVAKAISLKGLTARDAWITLHDHYEMKVINRVANAVSHVKQPSEPESARQLILRLTQIHRELTEKGITMEQLGILQILDQLSDEYKYIHTHWYNVPIEQWTQSAFQAHAFSLIDEPGSENNPIEVAMRADEN